MRLGQLSRKINVRTAEIVTFLASEGIAIQENANSRVNDPEVKLVLGKFAPHLVIEDVVAEEPVTPAEVEPVSEVSDVIDLVSFQRSEATTETSAPEATSPQAAENEPESPGENDVIKAPKIELQGLKVLGKIELPQPKRKEESDQPEIKESQPEAGEEKRKKRHTPDVRRQRERPARHKNPIAAQREREQREAEEKKKEELRRQKESKTNYYLTRVKPSAPVRKASLIDEPLSQIHEEAPDQPKTLWGKFMKWLTSY